MQLTLPSPLYLKLFFQLTIRRRRREKKENEQKQKKKSQRSRKEEEEDRTTKILTDWFLVSDAQSSAESPIGAREDRRGRW